MVANSSSIPVLSVYEKPIAIEKQVKYLGVLFDNQSSGTSEFATQLAQGFSRLNQLKPVLKQKDISAKLKARLIQAMVFPVVSYGCEAWTLTKDQWCKLRAFETKCYRATLIKVGRLRVKNKIMFILADCKPLLAGQCMNRKLSYFGHIVRHQSLEKDIMLGMSPGVRKQGGQKRLWSDDITWWLSRARGVPTSLYEAVQLAQDRSSYKALTKMAITRMEEISEDTVLVEPQWSDEEMEG